MEMKRKRKLDDSNEHASMLPPKTSPGLMGNLFKAVHGGSDTSSKLEIMKKTMTGKNKRKRNAKPSQDVSDSNEQEISSQSDGMKSVSMLVNESADDLSSRHDQPLVPKDETKPCCNVTTVSTKPQELTLTQTASLLSSKSFSVNQNDQMKQTSLNSTTLNGTEKSNKEEHCKDSSVEVKQEAIVQPNVAENTEIQASILALESLLQVDPGMHIKEPKLNKPRPISNSERIVCRNNKWEIDEKRGAQATLGPVLYANICLTNLKEKYPEWTSRAAVISYTWQRQLSSETKRIYTEMARKNRLTLSKLQREKAGGKQTNRKAKQSGPKCLEAGEPALLSASHIQNAGSHLETSNNTNAIATSQSTKPTRCQSTSSLLSASPKHGITGTAASHLSKLSTTTATATSHLSKSRCQSNSGQRKSLGDFTEIHLDDTSININASGLQLAIRRHSSTKTETSPNPDCKVPSSNPNTPGIKPPMDSKKFMEQSTDAQIEFFRLRARYLRYRKATSCLIFGDDLRNDAPPSTKECLLTGDYGKAKLKGNWDTYANYPLGSTKKE